MSSVLDIPSVRDWALRLTVEQYHRLCDTGIVPERTELLGGIVVARIGKSPRHTWTVEVLAEWLRPILHADRIVRMEQPLTLADSEPEPDIAILRGTRDDFRQAHLSTAELVIEVAVTTEEIDRAKAHIYARAGIGEYWLVLPEKQEVVVHRDVQPSRGEFVDVSSIGCDGALTWWGARLSCVTLFGNR